MHPTPCPEPPASSSRAAAPPAELDVAARTDIGRERDGNEDSFLIAPLAGFTALAVCDGMGGAAGGEVASRTAADAIRDALSRGGAPAGRDALGRRLLRSVEEASARVFATARERRSLTGMGTTTTACAIAGGELFMAQVGDSRAYLLRGGELTQLTRDQTLATILVERGQLAPEDVATFPYGHVILQAVGTHERVEVDLTSVPLSRGDVLLVCSDGLHGSVPPQVIREVLASAPSAEEACEALIAAANEAGGPDNITCIVARVMSGSPPDGPPAPAKAILADDVEDTQPVNLVTAETLAVEEEGEEDRSERGVLARLAAIFRRRAARS